MGCFSSKPSSEASPKEKLKPRPKSDPLVNEVTFHQGNKVNAVLVEGLAILVSSVFSPGDCSTSKSRLKLSQEDFFKLSNPCVVFVTANPVSNPRTQFSCAIVEPATELKIGDHSVTVRHANHQRIYYPAEATREVRVGTAVRSGEAVIGLHEKPGCAISFQWICHVLKRSDTLPDRVKKFVAQLKDEVKEIDFVERIYGLHENFLVSLNPAHYDFIEHAEVPKNAKMCILASGVYFCGGVEHNQVTDKILYFDCASESLSVRGVLDTARQRHCVCLLQDYVYCISGEAEKALITCERYNVQKGSSDEIETLSKARMDAGAVGFQGVVYVIGGFSAPNSPEPGIIRYQNDSWDSLEVRLPAFSKPVIAAADSDSVYICSSKLTRWSPSTNEIKEVLNEDFSGSRSVMMKESLFLFIGRAVVQINKDPISVSRHANPILVE